MLDRRELATQRLTDAIDERERREAEEGRATRRRRITGWITRPLLVAALLVSTAWLFSSLRDMMRHAMAMPKVTSPFDAILLDTGSAPAGPASAPAPATTSVPPAVMVTAGASAFDVREPTFAITLPAEPVVTRADHDDASGSTSTSWQTSTPTATVAVVATDFGVAPMDPVARARLANLLLDRAGSNNGGTITSDQTIVVAGMPARSVVIVLSNGTTVHATTVWHGSVLMMVCGTQRDGSAAEPAEYRAAVNSLQLL